MRMRRIMAVLIWFIVVLKLGLTSITHIHTDNEVSKDTSTVVQSESEPVIIIKDPELELNNDVDTQPLDNNFHSNMSCDWDSEDGYLLAKMAMAEAEGEDIYGKAHVMMVILNRMLDDEFADTISGVIYEKIPNSSSHQFSSIDNGRFDRVEPNDECWQALNMIMVDKWDKSQGALYFESCPNPDNWHSRNLEYLFTHGCHRFYK
jgi:spore germination cell wall hydrolase CwlJ-like protein